MGFQVFKATDPDAIYPRKDYTCLFQHRYTYTYNYMYDGLEYYGTSVGATDFFRDIDEVLDVIKSLIISDEQYNKPEYDENRFKYTITESVLHWHYLYSEDELIEQFKDSGEAGNEDDENAFKEEFEVWMFDNTNIFKYKGTVVLLDKTHIDAAWSRSNTRAFSLIVFLEEQLENIHAAMYKHWLRLDHPYSHKLYPNIVNERAKQRALDDISLAIDETFESILRICSEYGFEIGYEIVEDTPNNYILERSQWLSQFKEYAPNKALRVAMSILYSIIIILFEGIDE